MSRPYRLSDDHPILRALEEGDDSADYEYPMECFNPDFIAAQEAALQEARDLFKPSGRLEGARWESDMTSLSAHAGPQDILAYGADYLHRWEQEGISFFLKEAVFQSHPNVKHEYRGVDVDGNVRVVANP